MSSYMRFSCDVFRKRVFVKPQIRQADEPGEGIVLQNHKGRRVLKMYYGSHWHKFEDEKPFRYY